MMRRGGLARAGLLASVLFVSTAVAAEPLPDPASVSVPTITDGRDPKIVADGWKYFYFWRADTTYAEAYRDIADCYRFLPVANADFSVPAFAPWTTTPNKHVIEPTYEAPTALLATLWRRWWPAPSSAEGGNRACAGASSRRDMNAILLPKPSGR